MGIASGCGGRHIRQIDSVSMRSGGTDGVCMVGHNSVILTRQNLPPGQTAGPTRCAAMRVRIGTRSYGAGINGMRMIRVVRRRSGGIVY